MAIEKEVKINIDTNDAEKSIGDVVKSVDKLTDAFKETTKKNEKEISKLGKATKSLGGGVKKLAKGFSGIGFAMKAAGFGIIMKLVDKLGEALTENQTVVDLLSGAFETVSIVAKEISDIFIGVFKSVSDSTGGFDALQKVLGGALSISINVIVGAIQGVVLGVQKAQLAWEDSFFGDGDPKEIKRLNEAIGETEKKLEKTGENISNAGKQIGDNFLEAVGEVGSLAVGVAEGVSKVIDEVDLKQAYSDGKRVARSKKNFELLALQQQRLVEEYDLQAESLRQIRDDESKSIEERIKANKELGDVLIAQSVAEKKTVSARLSALQTEEKLKGKSVELTNEIYALQTEMIAIDAKVAGFKSEQLTNIIGLGKEELEITNAKKESESLLGIERKRFNAEQIEDELLRLEKLKEVDELEAEQETIRLQAIVDNANAGTQAKVDAQNALDTFTEASRQKNILSDEAIAKKQIDLERQKTEAKKKALNDLVSIFGAESKMGKAALIGKQLMAAQELLIDLGVLKSKATKTIATAQLDGVKSTSASASGLAETLKLGFPAAIPALIGYVATAAGIVSGVMAATKKTKTVASGLGGSGSGGSVSAPPMPKITPPKTESLPPAFNVVGASNTSQLADAIGGQSQQPIQTYVVSSDITTSQEMERNIITGASI